MSKKEIGKHFNICNSSVQKLIEEWNLKRDQNELNKISAKKSATSRESPYKNFTQERIEELKDFYLNQNKSYEELREYFHGSLFGCYGKGTSNEELMKEHGFVEIYDRGQQSFEWRKDYAN